MSNICHTVTNRGKRVAVQLRNGQLIEGKFERRANNNRWIEVWVATPPPTKAFKLERIQRSEIVSMSVIKGNLDMKRLGRKQK